MRDRLTAVEVCAGAGGQALGLELAGFEHLACVELDAAACCTLRRNRPGWNVVEADLREWEPAIDLGDVDLLAGGVPCPPFSIAGKQLGAEDERDLFPEMVRLARILQPKAIMIENVRGLLGKKFTSYRAHLLEEFQRIGYVSCGWKLINAADFGVPQNRTRSILVLVRPEYVFDFEWPVSVGKRVTVCEVLLPLMSQNGWESAAEWAVNAQDVAPTLVGGSKKHGGADLGPSRARLAWLELGVDGRGISDLPPGPGFNGLPRLTLEMAAAVQGFPSSWVFEGKKTPAYRQIGNAFPPPVAQSIGLAIRRALEQ